MVDADMLRIATCDWIVRLLTRSFAATPLPAGGR